MQNKIPTSLPALLAMARQASNGAGTHAAGIPLLQNNKTAMDAEILALTNKIMEYGAARNVLADYRQNVSDTVDTARLFLLVGRDSFKPQLGFDYNERWDVTGLIGSLAIPRNPVEVLLLLQSFQGFLVANEDLEIESKNITAIHAGELYTQLDAAITALNEQQNVVGTIQDDRDAKGDIVRKRMADVIAELKIRLDSLDNRWLAFGLNKPGADESPDGVEHVIATLIGPTAVALKWDSSARAEYYHVFKRVQGVDEDYVLVGSPADLDFTIENLPSGKQIDVVVSAVNSGGEGQRSEAVTITTQ